MSRRENHESARRNMSASFPGLLVGLIIAAAVVIGLLMPNLFTAVQGRRADGVEKQLELGMGSLSLTSDDAKLEKLRLMREVCEQAAKGEYMETVGIKDGRFMTAGDIIGMLDEVLSIIDGTGLPCGSFTSADIQNVEPRLVIADATEMTTAIIWSASLHSSDGGEYRNLNYYVDDSTGIVVEINYECYSLNSDKSFVPASIDHEQALEMLAENLAESYCLSDTEIIAQKIGNEEINPYDSSYYIYFMRDGETVFQIPVFIGMGIWSVNYLE